MGNVQTAIATICGGVLMLIVFGLLHILKRRHHQNELAMAVYGIGAGMAISFVLFNWYKVTSDNRETINAISSVISLIIMLLSLHYLRPRRSPPNWLQVTVWLVLTVTASALCISFSQIYMGAR